MDMMHQARAADADRQKRERMRDAAPEMYELLRRADRASTSDLERSDRTWFRDVMLLLTRIEGTNEQKEAG